MGYEKDISLQQAEVETWKLKHTDAHQSLQSQIIAIEADKEEKRTMYKKDISLQQAEAETWKPKHTDTVKKLDSFEALFGNLKAALGSEKANAQILLQQFKRSEQDRKSYLVQKE